MIIAGAVGYYRFFIYGKQVTVKVEDPYITFTYNKKMGTNLLHLLNKDYKDHIKWDDNLESKALKLVENPPKGVDTSKLKHTAFYKYVSPNLCTTHNATTQA